ncbi:30S ribosomal protein S13 [Candidatus Pacearchaeota archaeon]|nr:30S ribosomal protein S13 [Candidatus Pacearchaeota archaeon]
MEEIKNPKEKPIIKAKKPEEKTKILAKSIVRILGADISGEASIYPGLTRVKGVSWSFSNALCTFLGIDKKRKISSLNASEIEKISSFMKKPAGLKDFLLNRRRDIETGENKHLITSDLELQRDFDIRRMKQTRSYKGWRHALGQPVRGQRTRSHFRKGRSIGVQRAKKQPAKAK